MDHLVTQLLRITQEQSLPHSLPPPLSLLLSSPPPISPSLGMSGACVITVFVEMNGRIVLKEREPRLIRVSLL